MEKKSTIFFVGLDFEGKLTALLVVYIMKFLFGMVV